MEIRGRRKGHLKPHCPAAAPQFISEQGCPELGLVQEVSSKIGDFIAPGLFLR